jgi:peptide subunit release factor 1 (eRF1)
VARAEIGRLDPVPRALAAFVASGPRFARIVPLGGPLVSEAYWDSQFRTRPLRSALEEHERTIVALVDQDHAHLYRVFLGQVEEVAHLDREPLRDENPRSSHQKPAAGVHGGPVRMGYGDANYQRRFDWHVHRHLDRLLSAIREGQATPVDRLLVGGNKETVQELLTLLPDPIRRRTRLVAGLPVEASAAEVLNRITTANLEAEREKEEELLDNLREVDAAHAVFGAPAVLEAVADERVHTLVYTASLTMEGSECVSCRWLTPGPPTGACPRCGAVTTRRPDLVERLIELVVEAGGRVEEVRGPGARTLERSQGLAARLRYTPSTVRAVSNGSR